jgi:hypothetical protein
MIAFANSTLPHKAGILYVGVDNDGRILDNTGLESWQLKLGKWANSCFPQIEIIARVLSKGRLFNASCVVACPICHGSDSAVCELDVDALHTRKVMPKRMACTNCDFVVLDSQPFLSEVLVGRQLEASRESILKEYGIK